MGLRSTWHDAGSDGALQRRPRSHQSRPSRAHGNVRLAIAGMTAALVCGCVLGPDFLPPVPPPDTAGYSAGRPLTRTVGANVAGGAAQRFVPGRDIPGDWWRLLGSRQLGALTERALKNNPDLAAAQAALRVAQANLAAGRAAFFPTVSGTFSSSRQMAPVTPPTPDANGNLVLAESPAFNLFTGQVNVSYTPDVFGGIRRNVESLQAQSESQRFQLEATYLTLTSNIVVAAIQEASLRGQIDATRRLVQIGTDVLKLLRTQFDAGQIAESDVLAQQATLAQIEQALPALERQLAQQRHLLSALTGGLPSQEPPEKFTLSALRLPRYLPVSLPSQLVRQRPDLRAAEENLHAASAQIGVAVANRLPNVTLTGNLGRQSLSAAQLFSPGTGAWAIAGEVVHPIFDAGALYQKEVAARATFEQATSQYRSTVITAFQNVADSLSALEKDAVALQKAVAAEDAANKSLTIARRRLELGDINYILLLNAQQTYFQALLSRTQAQANRLADTVALFQALGGGWWNREDRDPPKDYPYFNFTD
jgi:NodT family efflux transporter outer membrane factor (OMF) lipoprotein